MSKRTIALCLSVAPLFAQERAPKNELAFQVGGFGSVHRASGDVKLDLGPGIALQSNYARRVKEWRGTALYGEVHFLASPLREVTASTVTATRDVASLYVTPGVRVKFTQVARVSPYVAAGAGAAWYEQSTTQLSGALNTAPRETVHGAFNVGGGVDIRVWRRLALRSEIRDFFTGSPAYNVRVKGGQHNLVAGAAVVLRWGE